MGTTFDNKDENEKLNFMTIRIFSKIQIILELNLSFSSLKSSTWYAVLLLKCKTADTLVERKR